MPEPVTPPAASGAPTGGEGQQPVPSTPSGNQGTPAQPVPGQADPQSPVANPEAQKYAQEAAALRQRIKEFERELKKRDDDQLSKKQKREKEAADAQTHTLELEARNQRLSLENTAHRLAATLGIADMGAALALVKAEHEHEIQYDESTQQPKNLDKLLKLVLSEHPILGTPASGQQNDQPGQGEPPRLAASSGGATNPGAGARANVLTREAIIAMSPAERMARLPEINAWAESQGRT